LWLPDQELPPQGHLGRQCLRLHPAAAPGTPQTPWHPQAEAPFEGREPSPVTRSAATSKNPVRPSQYSSFCKRSTSALTSDEPDSLQRALIALSERSQVSQQLLASHLQQAQDRLLLMQNQLAEVETRVEHLLCVLDRLPGGAEPAIDPAQTVVQKLDLLQQALNRIDL
jgi:hypothetical protein